mmetsp:Transcript_15057/g.38718  ORF Transcript_15057/g.38718 Transcript_15057/m.38718 type:complete len:238 (+) Transcript_15057:148-861(+)
MSTVHNNIMGYRSVSVTAIMAPGSALRILSAPPGTIGTVGSPASCKVQTCAPALGKPAPGDTSRCHLPASGRCGRLQPVRPVTAGCGNLGDGNMTAMGLNGGLACSSASGRVCGGVCERSALRRSLRCGSDRVLEPLLYTVEDSGARHSPSCALSCVHLCRRFSAFLLCVVASSGRITCAAGPHTVDCPLYLARRYCHVGTDPAICAGISAAAAFSLAWLPMCGASSTSMCCSAAFK